tara:strand:+ start:525 stop:836 length:312 start_codon:yes stop_codon:yes gene_type:complete
MSDFLAITQRFASINESSSPKQARVSENDELRAVAEQFEAIFVQELMKASRAAKLFDDPLETSSTQPFTDMMDQKLALQVSNEKSLGIAEAIVSQFSKVTGRR